MKTTTNNMTFAIALALAALTGCGGSNQPITSLCDGDDCATGGAGGTGPGGTGGSTSSNGGHSGSTSTGSAGNGGTGGGAGTTGSTWAVFSFDVHQSDDYNTWTWVDQRTTEFASCFSSSSCKTKMMNNDPSQRWQFLGDSDYSEAYSGNLGGFSLGRNASTCGRNIRIQSATQGLCWGEVKPSAGSAAVTFKTQSVSIGWNSGDKCLPGAITALCENAITITQYENGTQANVLPPQDGDDSYDQEFEFSDNLRKKVNAKYRAQIDGPTAVDVRVSDDSVIFTWDDGTQTVQKIDVRSFGSNDG